MYFGRKNQTPEALFKPSLMNKEDNIGLHHICNKIIENCGQVKKEIYNCIYLTGGNSLFKGLSERLSKEIKALASKDFKEEVNVIESSDAKFSAWIGGKIISELKSFNDVLITKEMYEESGSSIVYKKDPYMFK